MNKIILYTVLLIPLALAWCINPDKGKDDYIRQADFNPETRTLTIPSSLSMDSALQQVIYLSNIRKEGYGVILNIDRTLSQTEIDTLVHKFRKQDINAVHAFEIQSGQPVAEHILVAVGSAHFVWVIGGKITPEDSLWFEPVNGAKSEMLRRGGILVESDE